MTKKKFFVDQVSGMVSKIEYINYAENDSNAGEKTEIFFSDYRVVSGIAVPFRQVSYADGRRESELVLTSVVFNVGLSDAEFALPQ